MFFPVVDCYDHFFFNSCYYTVGLLAVLNLGAMLRAGLFDGWMDIVGK